MSFQHITGTDGIRIISRINTLHEKNHPRKCEAVFLMTIIFSVHVNFETHKD